MNFFLELILLFLTSCVSSYLIMQFGIFGLKKAHILDHPERYPAEGKRAPAPYGIGIFVFLNFFILSLFVFTNIDLHSIWERKYYILLILATCIAIISFIDDLDTIDRSWFSVHPLIRLFFQIFIGAVIGITSIKISYMSNILGGFLPGKDIIELSQWAWHISDTFTIYWVPLIFTIIWYVLVFNSLNWSDGVPGLTGGLSVITLIIVAVLSIKLYLIDTSLASQENSKFVLRTLMILIPSVILLTYYDITRKGIMGDSGTMFLGFIIATLAIIAGGKIATASSVLGIYFIDAIYVIALRIYNGKNPLKGDKIHHLHYRLMQIGLNTTTIRSFIYTLAFFFGIAAIFLDRIGKVLLFLLIAIIVIFITKILTLKKEGK